VRGGGERGPIGRGRGAFAGALLAAIAAVIALILAAPAFAVPRGFYGVVPQTDTVPEAEFARMGTGKVGSFRWPLSWRLVEKSKGTYDWAATDDLMTHLATNGIEPRPFVCCVPEFFHKDIKKPPTGHVEENAWRDFLRAAVRRYGPNGEFWTDPAPDPPTNPPTDPPLPPLPLKSALQDNPITDWQILNEPNSSSFTHPKPDPARYAHLLEISSKAIRDVDPKAYIVLGGMFGTPHPKEPPAKAMNAWKFLGKIYKHGAGRFFDAAASHPYARNLDGVGFQIKKFRKVMKRHHDRRADIAVTEMGWGSKKHVASFLGKGKKGQAQMLKRSFRLLKHKRNEWNIHGVMWFTWKDRHDPAFCAWCDSAGLFSKAFKPKPAWKRFVKFTGGSR
jgi:hypothetical protein